MSPLLAYGLMEKSKWPAVRKHKQVASIMISSDGQAYDDSLLAGPSGKWPSEAKWVAAFGNLTPYAPNQHVPRAYEPFSNKTFMADSDHGGFNNMRMCWEEAICYAFLTRRIYRVPPLSDFFGEPRMFRSLFKKSGRPLNMFSYYDERSFKMVIPSMLASDPLPVPGIFEPDHSFLKEPPEKLVQSNLVYTERTRSLGQFAGDPNLVPHQDYVHLIQSALRVRWDLIRRAAEILEANDLQPGQYVALHRRRGDFDRAYFEGREDILSNDIVVKHVAPEVKGRTVLVLTDTADNDFLEQLVSVAGADRVVCWANKTVTGFDSAFAPQLDMLAAVPAAEFIATPVSTFSWGILRWRIQAGSQKAGTALKWISSKAPFTPDGGFNSPGAPGTW